MKKLPLTLVLLSMVSVSIYFLSCKKEAALLLPAVQMARESAKKWEIVDKTLLQATVTFSNKLKPEYENFDSDSTIAVSVWVRFEGQDKDVLLPYVVPGLGGTKYYFCIWTNGKPKIVFHNSAVCDFNTSGTSSVLPMEQVSFNFTKITY